MKNALLLIWQLPQHLLGAILVKVLKPHTAREVQHKPYNVPYVLFKHKSLSGVSLGIFILLNDNARVDDETVLHEHGHQRQSQLLGPLYLPIIGLYSAVFCNLWDRVFHKDWQVYDRMYWYYKTRWTERWADKLGGVDRDAWIARYCQYTLGCRYPKL